MSTELRSCPVCHSKDIFEAKSNNINYCNNPECGFFAKKDKWLILMNRDDAEELADALKEIKNEIEDCDECRCDEVIEIARTALAKWE